MKLIKKIISKIRNLFNNMYEDKFEDPNTRYFGGYDEDYLEYTYEWNCSKDVDEFFRRFNFNNNYTDSDGIKLGVGDRILINDDEFDAIWEIAGFDLDDVGISLIPVSSLGSAQIHNEEDLSGGLYDSDLYNKVFPYIENKLRFVLEDHLIKREFMVSSYINSEGYEDEYECFSGCLSLLSRANLGDFSYTTGYNWQKLPLFNFESPDDYDKEYWLAEASGAFINKNYFLTKDSMGYYKSKSITGKAGLRPMICVK